MPQATPQASASPVRTRPLWVALGLVLCVLGVLGLILPGVPGTVWFVLAAGAFSRGDPRWEAWLLSRPVVGELVRDYHAGRGMPLQAKCIACVCIALAVGLSLPRIPVVAGQVGWVLLGLVGVWFIVWRVPTRRGAELTGTDQLKSDQPQSSQPQASQRDSDQRGV